MATEMDICQQLQLHIGERYNEIKKLGQGTFGTVLLAQDKKSGDSVALKLVRKKRTDWCAFLTEVRISYCLSMCKEIITTYPTIIDTMGYYIFSQELAPAGTLDSIIEYGVGIPEAKVKRCAEQLANALSYMHHSELVHADLKPNNILLMDKDCHRVKLGDFGLSRRVGHPISARSRITPYFPPELCKLKKHESLPLHPSLDTWAFGILLLVTLIGRYPWEEATLYDRCYITFSDWQKSGKYDDSPPLEWWFFTQEGCRLFSQLLALDPSVRTYSGIISEYLPVPWGVFSEPYNNCEFGSKTPQQAGDLSPV